MKYLRGLVVSMMAGMISNAVQSAVAFELTQGVIADSGRGTVYLMSSDGGIEAVSLGNGQVMAASEQEAKPLLLYDDTLLTQVDAKQQSGMVVLLALSATDLKPGFQVELALPNEVQASISDRLGASFHLGARVDDDEIVVQWRSILRRVSGIPTREPARMFTGFARIDPKTGRLLVSGGGEAPSREGRKAEVPVEIQKQVASGRLAGQPCRVDDLLAAIEFVQANDGSHALLRRWNAHTGKSLPNVKLFGSDLIFQNFSADCRDLLASRAKDGWSWSIFSMTTGKLVAEVHNSLPGSQFFVWKDSLIYELPVVVAEIDGNPTISQPRRLLAMALGTGKELWTRPIRETKYLGPYPGNFPSRSTKP